jgi:putative membrane protein
LVADHRAAQTQLKAPAAQAKLAMPGEMDVDHQKLRDELAALDGPAFDSKFVQLMTSSHDDAVRMFEAASKSPKLTQELQAYASAMLPKLRAHAQAAHKLSPAH